MFSNKIKCITRIYIADKKLKSKIEKFRHKARDFHEATLQIYMYKRATKMIVCVDWCIQANHNLGIIKSFVSNLNT